MDSVATSRQFSVKHQPDLNFSRIEGDGIPRGSQQLSGIRHVNKSTLHPHKKRRGIK